MLGFFQSECMPKHNTKGSILGSILEPSPALGTLAMATTGCQQCQEVALGHTHIWCCVPMDAGPFTTSPGLGHLEEAAASGRCYPSAFPHLGAFPSPSHALCLTPTRASVLNVLGRAPGGSDRLLGEY